MPFSPARAGFPKASTPRSTAASARATRSEAVAENRARMAARARISPAALLVPFQVHSSHVITVSAPWTPENRPRCDGLVTATPGLALGVTGADCGMVLFADPCAKIIGAAHAGWKGALNGVVEATVAAMVSLGAKKEAIRAGLGPCIAQESYEVGSEFYGAFASGDPGSERFFVASERNAERNMFDLHGYIAERARRAGLRAFRRQRPRHLRRRGALLQLSKDDAPQGTGLWAAGGGDCACVAAALHPDPGVEEPGGCRRMRDPRQSGRQIRSARQ